ncbi:MAG: hypothetical protein JO262_05845 [Solirubrobacterales bacterium]|nr:hypothetical protein [Solirubrobacterales bacterium]
MGLTGAEPSLLAWQIALDRAGTPYEVLGLQDRDGRAQLISGMRRSRFQALIVAGAETIGTGLSSSERTELQALERTLGTRRLVAYAYPSPVHGLRPPFWAGPLDGLTASLTPLGRRVFPYLRDALDLDAGSWGYLAAPISPARFVTLLAASDGSPLLGLYRHRDGREEMVQTFAMNACQSHALLLRFGQLAWVSGGSYLGFERNYLPIHIDDVLLANHSWNVVTHRPDDDPGVTIRITADDVAEAATWSRARDLRLDMACNGYGSERYCAAAGVAVDPVLDALLDERRTFGWINHTYSHGNLDEAPRATIEAEIERNLDWARRVGIELEPDALVTGEHSGLANVEATPRRLENPELAPALRAKGVRYIGCDASRPYPAGAIGADADLPAPGIPFEVGPALAIPRHPSALPFDSATRHQAVDRWRTHRRADPPPTWEQVMAAEATRIFVTMLSNDPRPHYFHQSNLVSGLAAQAPEGALLYELIDVVLHRYRRSVRDMPIAQPTFGEVGEALRDRAVWDAACAAGTVVAHREAAGVRIENRSGAELRVPLTGTIAGTWCGATRSGWIPAEPGETFVALDGRPAAV